MNQLVDAVRRKPALADAVDDALRQLRRRRQALGLHEGLRFVVEPDQISEGPADIDSNEDHALFLPKPRDLRREGEKLRLRAGESNRPFGFTLIVIWL